MLTACSLSSAKKSDKEISSAWQIFSRVLIVGDFLLKKVACRLLNSVRKSDFVARLSGDEFAVILDDIHGKHAPGIVASNICKAIAKPFRLKKNIINITISIGIVYIPSNSVDPEELINRADTAMYRAKTTGANGYQFSD